MTKDTHDYAPDARNAAIRINSKGELVALDAAKASLFDADYVLGDGIWKGLRVHDGGLPFLFIVRKGEVGTSTGKYCLGDITRANAYRA